MIPAERLERWCDLTIAALEPPVRFETPGSRIWNEQRRREIAAFRAILDNYRYAKFDLGDTQCMR